MASIKLQNIRKSFGNVDVINGVDWEIEDGEFVVIVGPSGCGKSTLLHLMSGLDHPDTGQIFIDDRQPGSAAQWQKIRARQIGFIFQAFHLLPTFTVLENIEIPMFGVIQGVRQRREKALSLASGVGLANRRNHYPNELSGGERQRVAIARALANSPGIILADEPTGNLDSLTSKEIVDLLIQFHKNNDSTLVIVSHDEKIALRADKVINLLDGQIM